MIKLLLSLCYLTTDGAEKKVAQIIPKEWLCH